MTHEPLLATNQRVSRKPVLRQGAAFSFALFCARCIPFYCGSASVSAPELRRHFKPLTLRQTTAIECWLRPRNTPQSSAFSFAGGEARGWNVSHPRATSSGPIYPSPLSCALLCPAPPVSTRPPLRLPCRSDAQLFQLSAGIGLLLLEALSSERSVSITSPQGWHRKPLRELRSLRGYPCSSPQRSRWEDTSSVPNSSGMHQAPA